MENIFVHKKHVNVLIIQETKKSSIQILSKRRSQNQRWYMIKTCGNCTYFIKWKNDQIGPGLCEKIDTRTKPDNTKCSKWKGIKYIRVKTKKRL
jgi:hypothetical protein